MKSVKYVSPLTQAYFLGCSMDTWSTLPWDRAYVVSLMVLAYFLPLSVIVVSYSMIYSVTKSTREELMGKRVPTVVLWGKSL